MKKGFGSGDSLKVIIFELLGDREQGDSPQVYISVYWAESSLRARARQPI